MAEVALWQNACLSLKKIGGAIVQKGTFYYLYIVLPFGRVIAMVHMNHRDSELESSRWCEGVIAMEWKEGPLVLRKETEDFR